MSQAWSQDDLDRFLRCPATGEPLRWADAELLQRLNRQIEAGTVMNRVGVKVAEPLDAGLVNQSNSLLYPCYGGLPTLLADETIALEAS